MKSLKCKGKVKFNWVGAEIEFFNPETKFAWIISVIRGKELFIVNLDTRKVVLADYDSGVYNASL